MKTIKFPVLALVLGLFFASCQNGNNNSNSSTTDSTATMDTMSSSSNTATPADTSANASNTDSTKGTSNTKMAGKRTTSREIVNGSDIPRTKTNTDMGTERDYSKPAKKGEGKGSNTGYVNKDSVDNMANVGNSR